MSTLGARAKAQLELRMAADEFRVCDAALREAYRSGDRAAIAALRAAFQAAVAWYLKAEADLYSVS